MARSTYPIPTPEAVFYIAHDGQDFTSEAKCRQHNAELAIRQICEDEGSWQGVVTADDVANFIMEQASAIGPWFDDLNG